MDGFPRLVGGCASVANASASLFLDVLFGDFASTDAHGEVPIWSNNGLAQPLDSWTPPTYGVKLWCLFDLRISHKSAIWSGKYVVYDMV